MAWLDSVNVERPGVSGPRRRLLSAQRDVFRVTSPEDAGGDAGPEADRRAARGESEESEGGYVAVTEMRLPRFSPQEGSLTQAVARDGTGHRTHTPSDRVPSGRRSRDPAAPNAQTERRQWTKASEQRRRGGEDADEDVLRWEKDETATGGEREREERRDRTEAAGKPGAAEAAPRREVRPTIRTGSGRGGDGGKKQAKGGPEGQEEKDSYFEKTTHARDPCPEKWRRRNTDAQDFGSQTLPQNIHTGDSYSEKLPQQNIHTEDFYSEKLPEQIQTEGSYSEKLPEQIPTEDSYSEMLPQQNIHTEDFYSEKLSEQIQTEGSYSEKLPEQTHNEDSYSENLPQKNIHIEDSYSEKLPQQNIHTEDFYSEKFPEQIQTEGSYSEKLPEQTHNEDSYSENLPQKNIHIEDSYSEKLPQQNIHTEDFYSETLPEQIQTEGSYSEKLPEQIPTEDSYSEKLPQQNIHTEDFYSEKLPEQIQTEGSYSEKLPEQIPTEDSYSEMLPQQNIHTEDFYSEKLPEQIQTEGSYSEKLPEQTHNEDSYSENLPQQNIHNEDFYSEKLPEQIHAEDFCSEKLPVQNIHNEDFHSETVQTKIHTEGSYCEKLPEQIQQMHSLAEDSYFEDGLAPVSIAARTKDSYCERKWQHGESYQSLASFQSGFSRMLLRSGVIALPGSRDRSGRALLTVDAGNGAVWSRPECRRGELLRLMLYYASTLSAADAPAVTALVDARRAAPAPALLAALEAVQEELPNRLRSVLVLIDRDADAPVRVDKRTQVEVLTSLECLAERVDLDQLPGEFGGSFRFSHSSWLAFRYVSTHAHTRAHARWRHDAHAMRHGARALCVRQRVEQLTNQCEDVIQLLRKNVDIMEDTRLPDTRQDAERQLSGYRALMSGVLGDGRLARLQREGGTSLSLLRRDGEGEGGPAAAAAADAVSHLYERADELLHRLVAVNNGRTRQLNFIRDFWAAADAFAQVRAWMEGEGELRLRSLGRPDGSPEALRRKRRDFRDFCSSARARCEEGEVLLRGLDRWRHVWTSDLRGYEVRVGSMRARLREFSRRVDAAGRQIDKAVALYRFLDHQEQFSLYALYSKNKPKSDALLANHGLAFFKRKQRELADKMDLCSYLLKPVQRMSKYALLLDDLIKEVGAAQEAELTSLQKAVAMVKFQLRHGNDLLAMDAIRHCDVNLKEQGQLLRQDQFTVWTGRRKCERRVFLFDELLLLSKAKKMDGRLDIFVYKHSFKTADLGLTESRGDDGLCFAIWFRRRTSKNQTLTLQAASADVKRAWTHELTRILWTQATRNKEARLKEMLSMGVGNKPYLDIRPSAAAISDRAVHYITGTRGARTRASIAVSASDRADPFKRVAPTSDPSSSSLLGSLNLHVFHHEPPGGAAVPAAGDAAFGTSPCIEEDEREHETASQPSMTTESSGSSSRRLSGSTGSDSGCASSSRLPDPSSASSSRSSRKPESSRARTLPI
ncbi:uncharacterized protein plekhg4 isoform X6 [Phyllopteryx taeniolatus]|uniref:uncharacterized protein plekhg4 isoform X6 n=1 Tax=Phyllopteryx taeniolatus TaxID=161469 RepID=UPI002AD4FA5C|nr:uncharacterized protein plekhg4 isoform X6 [Phyllopteryx taeniolatus]